MSLPEPGILRSLIHSLGWTLLHSLWECTAVALGLAVGLRALRPYSAHVRYAVACTALLIAAAWPAITFACLCRKPVLASVAAPGNPTAIDAALPWLVAAWFSGVLLLTLRLASGWTAVRRLRREGTAPLEGWLAERARELVGRLRIRGPVEFLTSTRVQVPSVCGVLRCTVLIPVSALTGIAPLELEALLAHELAHVRRYDLVVNLFQVAIETVLFYHPAVRWISERIRIERENCCDDLAVAVLGDRVRYVRALVSLEELRVRPHSLAMAGNGGSLPARVRRLLGLPAENSEMNAPWTAAVLSACLLLPVATLATTSPPAGPAAPRPVPPTAPAIAAATPAPTPPPVVSVEAVPATPAAGAPASPVSPAAPAATPAPPGNPSRRTRASRTAPVPAARPQRPALGIAPPSVVLPTPAVPATPSALPGTSPTAPGVPQPVVPASPSAALPPPVQRAAPPAVALPQAAPASPGGPTPSSVALPGVSARPRASGPGLPGSQPLHVTPAVPVGPAALPPVPQATPRPTRISPGALGVPVPVIPGRGASNGGALLGAPVAPAPRSSRAPLRATPQIIRPAAPASRRPAQPASPTPATGTVEPREGQLPNAPALQQQKAEPQQQALQLAPTSAADELPKAPPPPPAVPQP